MADDIEIYATGNWPSPPPTHQVGHGTRAGDEIKIWDLENVIYFKDATVLADTITALGGNRLYMSPAKARLLLGISTSAPFISATGAFDPAATIWIDFPMNRTHHYDPPIGGQWQVNRAPISSTGLPFGFNPNDIPFLNENVDWFVINGWTSVAAPAFPYPPYRYQWSFQLLQFGGAFHNPDTAPPAPAPISPRHWIEGFEAFPDGAGGSGGVQISRDSSRHIDGYGGCLRNDSNVSWLHSQSDVGMPVIATRDVWMRGYIRVRRLPATDGAGNNFCRIRNAINGENNLRITTTSQLELWTQAAALMASVPITVGDWIRLDLLTHNGAGSGTAQLYMNSVLVFDLSGIATSGFGQAQNWLSTALGAPDATGARGLELDLDDFVQADIPPALTGMDWLMGSRIIRMRPIAVASGVNWTGDFRSPIGDPVLSTAALISTATPSSLLRLNVDWHDQQLLSVPAATTPTGAAPLFQNGCAAAVLGWFCQGAGGTHNFRIRNGAGAIIGTGAVTVAGQAFYNAFYRPVGMITPTVLGDVTMEWETSASAGTNQVYMAHMQAEDLGIFGPEDLNPTVSPAPPPPAAYTGIHNAPYPRSPWALVGGMPQANVFIAYGLYTGIGTAITGPGADLNLPYPPCWIYVRPVAPAGATGSRWWSSEFTAHPGTQPGIDSPRMPQALQDSAFDDAIGNSLMRRAGNSSQANATTATFQYVAFCDPGQRFNTNGAFGTPTAIASAIQLLRLAGFIPEAGFFNVEQVGTLTTTDFWYKGVGHAGAFASNLNAAETNNVVSFSGAGQITSQTPLHKSGSLSRPQTAYSLWRTNDGVSSGPSQGVVVAIDSYVGDGNASRVIPLALGGRFPVYAQVTPHNALSWCRDPSHTGTTSCQTDNMVATSTTAITAGGINQITVGITLNALGVVYDVFVLPGCSQTGWDNNGGDFCPLNWGGYVGTPPDPYVPGVTVEGTPDLCVNDWDTPRADGLPYVPLMPGSEQDENQ